MRSIAFRAWLTVRLTKRMLEECASAICSGVNLTLVSYACACQSIVHTSINDKHRKSGCKKYYQRNFDNTAVVNIFIALKYVTLDHDIPISCDLTFL